MVVLCLVAYEQLSMLYACVNPALPKCCCGKGRGWWQSYTWATAHCICESLCRTSIQLLLWSLIMTSSLYCLQNSSLFSPLKCYELQPTVADIESLKLFPSLDSKLKAELPTWLPLKMCLPKLIQLLGGSIMLQSFPNGLKHLDRYFLSSLPLLQWREYFQFCKTLVLSNSRPWRTTLNSTVVQFMNHDSVHVSFY